MASIGQVALGQLWPRARSLPTFAAGIEFFSQSLNSGVVYFNVTTMLAERPRMLSYAVTRNFNFLTLVV